MNGNRLIVVGVDGSEGGRRALEWAAHEAAERGAAVQAVMAWSWDGLDYGPFPAANRDEAEQRATRALTEEVRQLLVRHGSHLPIATEVIEGRPANVLVAAARDAALLVLGSHGHNALRQTVLGSVSAECIREANCPVVVIPMVTGRTAPQREPALRR